MDVKSRTENSNKKQGSIKVRVAYADYFFVNFRIQNKNRFYFGRMNE
jgi:hypothetical protein